MLIDEFEAYAIDWNRMVNDGIHPLRMISVLDHRLAAVANHIVICHRNLAESRAKLLLAFLPSTERRLKSEIDKASDALDRCLLVQSDLLEWRGNALQKIALRCPELGSWKL